MKNRGFTLIEVLIYVAIFGVLISGVVVSAYPLMTGAERLTQRVIEDSESAFFFEKVRWALNKETVQSISGGSELTIVYVSGNSVGFREDSEVLEMRQNIGLWEPVISSRVKVSGFSSSVTAPSGVTNAPHVIHIEFVSGSEFRSRNYNVIF